MAGAANGPRLSKNYRLVYEIVQEQAAGGYHVPIVEVYERARKRQPQIGFATVYRAIGRLRDLQLVQEVHVPGATSAVYEPAGKEHAHFRCDACGAMHDVDLVLSHKLIENAARRLDAEVIAAHVTLHGRCARCRGGEGERLGV
jgi:Fe2+ or Zn2+ uptake regulation protein